MEELVRLMLDHWQEHRARRRREFEGARLHVIQQENEMASAARRALRQGVQPAGNLRALDEDGPRQDTPQRVIPDGSEPDPTAAGRRRNKKKTQRRTAAERRCRKTAASGAMRDHVDEMLIVRTELKVEGSSESEVNVGDTTHKCQKDRTRPPHEGQAKAEELARARAANEVAQVPGGTGCTRSMPR